MSDYPWIEYARKQIGTREIKGPKHESRIVSWWKSIRRGGIKDDETPWCAAFVGACFENSGVVSSRFESAKSYLSWGRALAMPTYGCVVVFTRQGGGHVGFVVGRDQSGNLMVLGGNQGDAVNIKPFPLGRVTGYRWPDGVLIEKAKLPLIASNNQASTNEA